MGHPGAAEPPDPQPTATGLGWAPGASSPEGNPWHTRDGPGLRAPCGCARASRPWALGSPARGEGCPAGPAAQLPVSCRYLISLGASPEATTDAGERPSDLIDPEYKELLELFRATTMD